LRQKIFLFILLCNLALFAAAQKPKVQNDTNHDDKPIHFGFSLGINMMDYRIEHSQAALNEGVYIGLHNLSPGINIHAIANLRLTDDFDLRTLPGISFGERSIHFKYGNTADTIYKAESSYLELPILLKFKSKRVNNFRPYLIGGGNFRYDLAGKGVYSNDQWLMINRFNIYGEIGMGLDFYLTYFKFATELKYSFGLSNILLRSDKNGNIPAEFARYTNYIDKLTSHMVTLLFHFE
jgi:hypothetical protein